MLAVFGHCRANVAGPRGAPPSAGGGRGPTPAVGCEQVPTLESVAWQAPTLASPYRPQPWRRAKIACRGVQRDVAGDGSAAALLDGRPARTRSALAPSGVGTSPHVGSPPRPGGEMAKPEWGLPCHRCSGAGPRSSVAFDACPTMPDTDRQRRRWRASTRCAPSREPAVGASGRGARAENHSGAVTRTGSAEGGPSRRDRGGCSLARPGMSTCRKSG
jgi:hypothetical protein